MQASPHPMLIAFHNPAAMWNANTHMATECKLRNNNILYARRDMIPCACLYSEYVHIIAFWKINHQGQLRVEIRNGEGSNWLWSEQVANADEFIHSIWTVYSKLDGKKALRNRLTISAMWEM